VPELSGFHILITRPTEQALRWQRKLRLLGAETQVIPVLEIEPVSSSQKKQAIKNKIQTLDHYQHLIFVSQNAVQYGMNWIDQYWPQFPVDQHYFAIGSTTAEALRERGLKVDADDQAMDSEALLKHKKLQSVQGSKVLIFRGLGGRPKIAEVLTQRGADVNYCELYERGFPSQLCQQLAHFTKDYSKNRWLISIHSGESLHNLLRAIEKISCPTMFSSSLLVPSKRVAEKAKKAGFTDILVASNASDEAMTQALIQWTN